MYAPRVGCVSPNLLTELLSDEDQIQEVDGAIAIYIDGVFSFQVNFVIEVGELAGFCFNQMSTGS